MKNHTTLQFLVLLAGLLFSFSGYMYSQGIWSVNDTISGTICIAESRDSNAFILKIDGTFVKINLKTHTKTYLNSFPNSNLYQCSHFLIDNKLYVLESGSNSFWSFHLDSLIWSRKADFPGAVRRGALGLSNENIGYVIKGYQPYTTTGSCWRFGPRYSTSSNYVYSDIYAYNPATNSWNLITAAIGNAAGLCTGFVLNKKLYFGSGARMSDYYSSSGCGGSPTVNYSLYCFPEWYEYNPASNTFIKKADINTNYPGIYQSGSRYAAVGFSIRDKGYIGNGMFNYYDATLKNYRNYGLNSYLKYDPVTDTWSEITTGSMSSTFDQFKSFIYNKNAYIFSNDGNMHRLSGVYNIPVIDSIVGLTKNPTNCPGSSFIAYYHAEGEYKNDNLFQLQMSDNNGTFNSPYILQTNTGKDSIGSFSASIPGNISGGNYGISNVNFRIVSTNEQSIGPVFGTYPMYGGTESYIKIDSANTCIKTNKFKFSIISNNSNNIAYKWYFGEASNDTIISNSPIKTYKNPGVYTITLTAILPSGCRITAAPITIQVDSLPLDLGVTANGNILTSNSIAKKYQWINCADNLPIAGETSKSFVATAGGNYAVIISDGMCSDTSLCIPVITLNNIQKKENELFLRLNDSDNTLTICGLTSNAHIRISDISSKILLVKYINPTENVSISTLPKGVYLVSINDNEGNDIFKFVKSDP